MKYSKKNSVAKKIIFSCLIVAAVLGVSYLIYYLVNYTFNKKYKDYLVGTEYAAGTDFKALSDSQKPSELPEGFVLAAKNDRLRLYYNETTTEVAVYDENSKKLTYTNPQGFDENDYDNNVFLIQMKSQFILYYYAATGSKMINEMSSYQYCTNIGANTDGEFQYSVQSIPNGIRVLYKVGNLADASIIPDFLSEETFDRLVKELDDYDAANGTRIRRNLTNVYLKSKTLDGFYELTQAGQKKSTRRNLEAVLDNVGWTAADFAREMEASGQDYEVPISFDIPLEYTLDNDKLVVNISTDHIVENGGASLMYIDLLPYFGAQYHQVKSTTDFGAFTYEIDETATKPVAVRKEIDTLTVNVNGADAKVTFPKEMAEAYNYCTFKLYEAESYESGEGTSEAIENWTAYSSNADIHESAVKPGVDYILEATGVKKEERSMSTETLKFVVDGKTSPIGGYYFVPNGSGSLIYMNSPNCDGTADYEQYIYGEDYVMTDAEVKTTETDSAKLPVYGWSTDIQDMFVILSRGESLAKLKVITSNDASCKASDSYTNYNNIFARYYVRTEGTVKMSNADTFKVWNNKIFDTQLTQKYCFLDSEHSGYSGMANYYRDYLVENGDLVQSEETKESEISLFLDIIGAIRGDTTFMGVTHESVIPVTTFKQAEKIADSFYQNDIRNLIVNYQGWMNGGYYHDTVDDISVIRKLGGKGGFEDLSQHLESQGGKLYGDMAVTQVSYGAKDFQYTLESSRIYGSGYVAAYGKTSPISYSNSAALGYRANLYDVLSPKYYEKYVKGALKDMKKMDVSGISFRDLGTYLYSDMKKTNIINREHTKEITEAMLKLTVDAKKSIMLNSALGYALAYADEIINAPIGDNNFVSVDCEVPFYEMIIHGYINYAGESINLSQDTTAVDNILSCIEYGASPHFTLSYSEATVMKYTALNNLYATNYVNWVDTAKDIYSEVNSALSLVTTASVKEHEILDEACKVRKITYSNGVVIYVNYSDSEVNADGIKLLPKSYWVSK